MASREPTTAREWLTWLRENSCGHRPKSLDEIMACPRCAVMLGMGLGGMMSVEEPQALRESIFNARIESGAILPVIGSEEGEA